jgi:uncharacterized OB-fold protein
MTQVPVAEGVFTWPSDDPRLIGGRCAECGTYSFPRSTGCARCTSSEMEVVELGNRGTLWTWTVQGFPPKAPPYLGDTDPDTFEAFGVGYVEIDGQLKVEARLTEADPAKLKIGMKMEMTIVALGTNEDGDEVVTYAFAPIDEETSP